MIITENALIRSKKQKVFLLFACMMLLFPFHSMFSRDIEQWADFSMDLKMLADLVAEGNETLIDPDRALLIDGVVTMIDVIDQDEDYFFAVVELTAGEWHGLEDVIAYRCYIQFDGPQFYSLFPDARSRSREPSVVELSRKVLIAGTYLGSFEDDWGNIFPVLLADKVRRLH